MAKSQNLLLRNRNFRLVWCGQVLSQAGSRAYFMNLLWWMVTRSDGAYGLGPAAWSGILLALTGLPSLIFVKWITKIIAARPSRQVLVGSDLAAAASVTALLAIELMGTLSPVTVLATSLLVAVFQALVDPTLVKAVPELVEPKDVELATGFESSTQALAFFAGAALGAVSSSSLGFRTTVAINIVTYVLSAILTAYAKFNTPAAADDTIQNEDGPPAVAPSNEIRPLLLSFAAANCFMFPIFLILPLYVNANLSGGILSLGVLEACFWFGLVTGAVVAPRVAWSHGFLKLCAGAYFCFGVLLTTLGFSASASPAWPALVLAAGGFSAGFLNVKVISYFQFAVASQDKPGFFARLQAYVGASQPISYLLFTLVLLAVTPTSAFVLDGVGMILVGAFCYFKAKR